MCSSNIYQLYNILNYFQIVKVALVVSGVARWSALAPCSDVAEQEPTSL